MCHDVSSLVIFSIAHSREWLCRWWCCQYELRELYALTQIFSSLCKYIRELQWPRWSKNIKCLQLSSHFSVGAACNDAHHRATLLKCNLRLWRSDDPRANDCVEEWKLKKFNYEKFIFVVHSIGRVVCVHTEVTNFFDLGRVGVLPQLQVCELSTADESDITAIKIFFLMKISLHNYTSRQCRWLQDGW